MISYREFSGLGQDLFNFSDLTWTHPLTHPKSKPPPPPTHQTIHPPMGGRASTGLFSCTVKRCFRDTMWFRLPIWPIDIHCSPIWWLYFNATQSAIGWKENVCPSLSKNKYVEHRFPYLVRPLTGCLRKLLWMTRVFQQLQHQEEDYQISHWFRTVSVFHFFKTLTEVTSRIPLYQDHY